jgi:hypothetical protein
MAWVVEAQTQKEGENHSRLLFQVCKELGEYSAVSPKSELGYLCAFDSAVHQELWILSFPLAVSPDAEGCWHHCFSTIELGIRGR